MNELDIKSKYLSRQLTLKIHSLHDKNHKKIVGKKEKINGSYENNILHIKPPH